MRLHTALIVSAAVLFAGAASSQTPAADEAPPVMRPGEGRDCFHMRYVRSYAIIDEHNVRVRFSRTRTYTLTTSENAADLDWGSSVGVSSDTGWVCTGDVRGAVYIQGGDMGNRYGVDTVTRDPYPLPEAEAEAEAEAAKEGG
jgi:hypothetical protein